MSHIYEYCQKNNVSLKEFVDWQIAIDRDGDFVYGAEEININCPRKIATVSFQLMDTTGLDYIADNIRRKEGYMLMYGEEGEESDSNGWYVFYIGVNDYTSSHLDTSIQFVVVNSQQEDNENVYAIDLTEEEQEMIYAEINDECKNIWGVDCEQLLKEARQYVIEGKE